jgi:hypothetical protein
MMANLLQKVLVSSTVFTVIGFSTILGATSSAMAVIKENGNIGTPNGKGISNIVFYLEDASKNITKVKVEGFTNDPKEYNQQNILQQYEDQKLIAYTVKAGKNTSNMGPGEGELFVLDHQFDESNLPKGATGTYIKGEWSNDKDSNSEGQETTSNNDKISDNNEGENGRSNKEKSTSEGEIKKSGNQGSKNKGNQGDKNPGGKNQGDTTPTKQEPAPTQSEDTTAPSEETSSDTQPGEPTFVKAEEPSTKKVKVPEPGSIAAIAIFGLGGLLRKKKASS